MNTITISYCDPATRAHLTYTTTVHSWRDQEYAQRELQAMLIMDIMHAEEDHARKLHLVGLVLALDTHVVSRVAMLTEEDMEG